ncbi:MAG: prolipoprotein diacylglyceryl transferase [Firmicutes bacterium HGW-Firmicutes-1]|jgi:phosphatidylglycerol:prolipoprotein diacylglycerol transferase|nr:MAG: prolipoprotein diacylglyceryl transferase [Firmicutes bacterium HGW-Firmicutes-1]
MNSPDIIFPNINIEFMSIDPVAFTFFGIEVYWYGIIICTGILAGLFAAVSVAKKTNQNPDVYSELLIYALIGAIIGARLYYVVFSWDQYKDNLMDIFALREGGLAIYGGVIGAAIVCVIFAKIKRLNTWLLVDTGVIGLILGQAIGRWGNFFNMEAFGGSTNSFLAMAMKVSKVKYIPNEVYEKMITINDAAYIQVHPTFFYESMWCLAVFAILVFYRKHKKFDGELLFIYFIGYGLGRFWIEGLRTDQLLIGSLDIPVSQLLSAILVVGATIGILIKRKKSRKGISDL